MTNTAGQTGTEQRRWMLWAAAAALLILLPAAFAVYTLRPSWLGFPDTTRPVSVGGGTTTGAPSLPPVAADSKRVVALGDIACPPGGAKPNPKMVGQICGDTETAALVATLKPDALLALGDLQYETGTTSDFASAYDKDWGQFKAITHPVIGNHEYKSGGKGYFGYFGSAAGSPSQPWYSFELGSWHIIGLDSNCDKVDCSASGAQMSWLKQDLREHQAQCTLAMFHHPRFSTGPHGDSSEVAPMVNALYNAGAEIVLNGHDHVYQRSVPLNADGERDDARGLLHFIVGTGGRSHYKLKTGDQVAAADNTSFGALRLDLHPGSFDWTFVPTPPGKYTDSGQGTCH